MPLTNHPTLHVLCLVDGNRSFCKEDRHLVRRVRLGASSAKVPQLAPLNRVDNLVQEGPLKHTVHAERCGVGKHSARLAAIAPGSAN